MYDKLSMTPSTIEGVTAMKAYISTLQSNVDLLHEKILKNDSHYALMEGAKWQITMDQMDVRWEVYRWPHIMMTEMGKQERNMRVLEVRNIYLRFLLFSSISFLFLIFTYFC